MTPRDAATVMLVRDAPDLEVFMLRRNLRSRWIGGAFIFPGGAVDDDDHAPEVLPPSPRPSDAEASARLGLPHGGLAFWIAAVRETYEEAGVLLARSAVTGAPIEPFAEGVADRLAASRDDVATGARPFAELLAAEELVPDLGALHPFSHWITPEGAPRRYDTWFFVAAAPDGHAYEPDNGETVDSRWVRPADAVRMAEDGEILLIFPTLRNLVALSEFATAAEVLECAGAVPAPPLVSDFGGTRIELPSDRAMGTIAGAV